MDLKPLLDWVTAPPTVVPSDRIMRELLPDWAERFLAKEGDYGNTAEFLGTKGQFSDINRKFWKLHRAVWLDHPLVGEQVPEILDDIIAHCFIMKEMITRG